MNNNLLPSTVTQLVCPNGSKVYLVGTAHFSLESMEDVRRTIALTQPEVVLVELCNDRKVILLHSEADILREARSMTVAKMRSIIRREGFLAGIGQSLFLKLTAELTQKLGVAPGGEFRAGYEEARRINADVVLGDRIVGITFKRALAMLSFWKKLYLGILLFRMLTSTISITPEEVEQFKSRDMVQMLLGDLTSEFPNLVEVLVNERDRILAHSLMVSANCASEPYGPPRTVVGIVGMGHVNGIYSNWMKVDDIRPLLVVPRPSRTSVLIFCVVKLGFRMGSFAAIMAAFYGAGNILQRLWTQ